MRHDLHIIAINIFNLCAANNIELEILWIPRNELEKADFFSRIIDIDDTNCTVIISFPIHVAEKCLKTFGMILVYTVFTASDLEERKL